MQKFGPLDILALIKYFILVQVHGSSIQVGKFIDWKAQRDEMNLLSKYTQASFRTH